MGATARMETGAASAESSRSVNAGAPEMAVGTGTCAAAAAETGAGLRLPMVGGIEGANAAAGTTASGRPRPGRYLNIMVFAIAAQIFFNVSGGPYGSEQTIQQAGGPKLALLGFLVLPFFWSIPEALVTSELATRFDHEAGYSLWVAAAMGERWGFMNGWMNLLSSITDNAAYPVLFYSYLETYIGRDIVHPYKIHVITGFITLMTLISCLNFRRFSKAMVFLAIFMIIPFFFVVLFAFTASDSKWDQILSKETNDGPVAWADLIATWFWSLNCWDQVSAVAGDIDNAAEVLPPGLVIGVVIVVSMYILPLIAGVLLSTPEELSEAKPGFFVDVAKHAGESVGGVIGGTILATSIVVAAGFSCMGQYLAEAKSTALLISGMASCGWFPKFLQRGSHNKREGSPRTTTAAVGSPRDAAARRLSAAISAEASANAPIVSREYLDIPLVAILFITGLIMLLAVNSDFQSIIALQNVPNAVATILECIAYLILRKQRGREKLAAEEAAAAAEINRSNTISQPLLGDAHSILLSGQGAQDAQLEARDRDREQEEDYFKVPIGLTTFTLWIIFGPVSFTMLLLGVMLWQKQFFEFYAFGVAVAVGLILHWLNGLTREFRPGLFTRPMPPGDVPSVQQICQERDEYTCQTRRNAAIDGASFAEVASSPYATGFVDAVQLANQIIAADVTGSDTSAPIYLRSFSADTDTDGAAQRKNIDL